MTTSKNRILDAAEQVVVRDGVAHLTIDAVAAEAHLSKGGVLYHFPSKDELIHGMIARLCEKFEAEIRRCELRDPCEKGRLTRAHLDATVPEQPSEDCLRLDQLSTALLAAVATNPSLLKPLHQARKDFMTWLVNDGIDPAVSMVVTLAADGIWLSELFGLHPLEPELRAAVLKKLHELTREV